MIDEIREDLRALLPKHVSYGLSDGYTDEREKSIDAIMEKIEKYASKHMARVIQDHYKNVMLYGTGALHVDEEGALRAVGPEEMKNIKENDWEIDSDGRGK